MSNKLENGFGERLKQAAESVGIPYSQSAIADYLDVKKQDVHSWMNGSLPRADKLWEMADKFRVDPRWFATGKKGDMSVTVHKNKRIIPSPKNAQKILAVLTTLLDTDDEGVNEIVAAAEAVMGENGATGKQRNRLRGAR